MDIGDFVEALHYVTKDYKIRGEIIAFDDDGYMTILEKDEELYIYSGHFYTRKLYKLEIELL
jgi:hypothetical protein